jgi:hypothetical protein
MRSLACSPADHLARGCKKRALVGKTASLTPHLSFHLARLFTTADPQYAIQSYAPENV